MANKRIKKTELDQALVKLDSDEGIRIEVPKMDKKIFINKNLFGVYIILTRQPGSKIVDKQKNERDKIERERFFYFYQSADVLKFLKKELIECKIFLY